MLQLMKAANAPGAAEMHDLLEVFKMMMKT